MMVVVFSCSVLYASFWPRELQHSRLPCSSLSPSLLKLISIESMMPSNHLVICHFFSSCLQSFPASGSLPVSQLVTSSGQSIGVSASASVLLMNIQGWFPLGLTGFISLQSKGISTVISSTTVWKHQFFSTRPSLWSLTSVYDISSSKTSTSVIIASILKKRKTEVQKSGDEVSRVIQVLTEPRFECSSSRIPSTGAVWTVVCW